MSKTLQFSAISLAVALGMTSLAHAAPKPTPTKTASKTSATKTPVTKTSVTKTTKTATKTTAKPTTETTEVAAVSLPATAAVVSLPSLPEPTITTITYPKANSVRWQGTDIAAQGLSNVPLPAVSLSDASFVSTVLIPQDSQNTARMDVSVLDDFISYVSPMARHYPPMFPSRTERYNATQRVKQLAAWIDEYAKQPNASYDVLLRAAKINAIARNLDLGSDYAIRASDYISRAIALNDTAEANFLYGVMLTEGGGFDEGAKYLEKAEKMGYAEATQSLAQADLLNDKKERAIQRLNDFKAKYPNDPLIDEQLRLVNNGKYYIWEIPRFVTP